MMADEKEFVGKIDGVTEHEYDGRKYKVINVDGNPYSVWLEDVQKDALENDGKEMKIVYIEKGKYKNVQAIIGKDETYVPKKKWASRGGFAAPAVNLPLECIKAAVSTVRAIELPKQKDVQTIVKEVADEYLTWIKSKE